MLLFYFNSEDSVIDGTFVKLEIGPSLMILFFDFCIIFVAFSALIFVLLGIYM